MTEQEKGQPIIETRQPYELKLFGDYQSMLTTRLFHARRYTDVTNEVAGWTFDLFTITSVLDYVALSKLPQHVKDTFKVLPTRLIYSDTSGLIFNTWTFDICLPSQLLENYGHLPHYDQCRISSTWIESMFWPYPEVTWTNVTIDNEDATKVRVYLKQIKPKLF